MRFLSGQASNVGSTRKVNQDAIILRTASFDENGRYDADSVDHEFAIVCVCDGIGGLEHGEISSGIVINGIEQWYDEILGWINIKNADKDVIFSHLKDAADDWNSRVLDFSADRGVSTGTTMSLLMIVKDSYFFIQVGDSRIYRYRDASVEQLTVDASVTRYNNGKPKNYLNNFMGKSKDLEFTFSSGRLSDKDLFIVCSDGFYHHFQSEDITGLTQAGTDSAMQEECEKLIMNMIERGEKDNLSVGVVKVLI